MKKFFTVLSFLILQNISPVLFAQASNYISAVKLSDAKEKNPLAITADLINVESISAIYLLYKTFGESEFRKSEMLVAGNTASVSVEAEYVIPPYLDYYLLIELKSGEKQTYPLGIDEGTVPLQVAVSGVSQKDKEIIILSPAEGELVSQQNLLISVSFFKAPDRIDISKTKVFFNDEEITSKALIAGDLLVISGENFEKPLAAGSAILKVEVYDKESDLYHTSLRVFSIVSEEVAAAVGTRWQYNGNIKAEARNENSGNYKLEVYNVSASTSASYGEIRSEGYFYFTSEEKSNLQPFNRYSLSLQASDWFNLKVGDSYPRFPSLILDGKRIRGISGSLDLGFFNIQAAYGETVRKVEGTIIRKIQQGESQLGPNIIAIDESRYGAPYAEVKMGTYYRELFALRPSFGSGENFQLGFTYLHSKDDPKSVEFGARPQENVVVGSDMKIAFDNQNILFTTQIAASLFNKDISSGTLSDAEIDSIFGPGTYYDIDTKLIKDLKKYLGNFITVNQYIGPLNPQELASLAGEAALSLNYLNNSLRASYIYRGNDYLSFGQSFIKTDIKGINITDRIRMLDNRLFFSFGYEKLEDNLQKTKIATTEYQTISAAVSFFPRTNFPNITFGYNRADNNNGISKSDPNNSKYAIDDITNRFLVQLSYDFYAGIKHNGSISFSTQTREDNSPANVDVKFNSSTISVNSTWNSQLSSRFQFIYSSSEIADKPFDFVTVSLGGQYLLLENKLQLSATLSPSFGDFERQSFEFLADYRLLSNLNLAFQARIYRFPGKTTNSIIGLVSRVTF